MHALTITADHWQAALEVPKQIALDLTAPLNLRLQASRMVQSMLKVILKDEKDRAELKQRSNKIAPPKVQSPITTAPPQTPTGQQENQTGAMPSSAWACEVRTNEASLSTSEEPSNQDVEMVSAAEPSEPRTRYIGRIGARKFRGKKRK
ncbi:hypothetical protein DTL21_11835 [Bremerella cremea]|uniref:Uncharacterized protein n=1 Tax=Blastopirellula marina TaxID=124 RepID=A0A2S8FPW6_9BACT|nr:MULTISPECIES: hypothetical protein [Pirellulaceae]PQO34219.1 hypothetical protein C5Y83_11830 [Blastopirellula marina]RCS46715.1 hypothetical protein DTL21_11835 [Bremerella cremea]